MMTTVVEERFASAAGGDRVATFGGLFIGFILSTTLYGLTFFQTYLYFSRYSKDVVWVKALIGLLWAIDTATTGLLSHTVYTYLITDFGIPFDILTVTSTLCAESALAAVAIFLVHLFYAARIWSLSKKNNSLASGAVVALAIPTFAFGIIAAITLFQKRRVEAFGSGILKLSTALNSGLAFLCDVVITSALFYYIHPARNETVKLPTSFAEKAIVYILNRGSITMIIQLAFFVAFLSDPGALVWLPFPIILGKVYVNALLVMLNYRESINGHGLYEEEVVLSSSGSAPLASIRFAVPATTKTSYMMKDTLRSGKETKFTTVPIELNPLESDGTATSGIGEDVRQFTSSSQSTQINKSKMTK